ncbi:class I mannose-6-phosphate isomerase [Gramella lutea]|uniref:Phosphohexomutase n=1 Tax=Christiangramia lutea TaxID=1607951 RepID=A0A9X2AB94_9FLAO|nr:type I phosphomannose isomerase catalytic subunit [Christiangramia lutea]MCH4823197.1 class I mannose-6-phosphate isomerase [Christiangramia lutea]
MINYPIKFTPIFQEKIWGGKKLGEILNKKTTKDEIGESWEISGVVGFISVVAKGPEKGIKLTDLIAEYKEDLVGKEVYSEFGNDFPLLIKFIDAKTDLSVQLHPNDELAKKRHNSFGKTEMWYVMQADEGSKLNIGFKKEIDKAEYLEHLENGKIVELLNFEKVEKGDAFFINTGKVHAIGGGVLLAEIQQTSDLTYRIYDWDRVDSKGNSRELHTELALDALDLKKKDDFKLDYKKDLNSSSMIASCEFFTTNFLPVEGNIEKDYSSLDSFVIYMCVDGEAIISIENNSEALKKGQTVLIPANTKKLNIEAKNADLLEIYIE